MDKKAVIFDMDGVLIDSWEPHYLSWKVSGEKYGFDISTETYAKYFGQTAEVFMEAILRDNNKVMTSEELAEWHRLKEEHYRKAFIEGFKENRSLTNLLTNLRANGFKTGIGSSAPKSNIQDLVDIMPEGECLKEYISADDVTRGKPDPEVFLLAAKKLGVLANKCAVIEDSIHGLKAARRAGMVAIGITGTHDKDTLAEYADMVIDDLGEVNAGNIGELIDK